MYLWLRGDCELVRYGDRRAGQNVGRLVSSRLEREGSNGRMPFAILATHNTPLSTLALFWFGRILELEMQVREDFTITETAPTMAFSWLKESIKTLCQMSIYLW